MKSINSFFIFIFVLFFVGVVSIASCKKEVNDDVMVSGDYKKNVLIEEVSAEWCGACPHGAEMLEDIISANKKRVFGVSIHKDDPFQLENPNMYSFLDLQFRVPYLPFAFFDRTSNYKKTWNEQTNDILNQKSDIGVGIETKINDDKLDITVQIASSKKINNTHLTVYLVENNVPESSPGAQAGASGDYTHQHLLRKVLTNKIGDFAPLLIADKALIKEYKGIKINKYKKEDLQVIAFVHYNVSGDYKVLNTNGVKVGESVSWEN